MAEAALMVQIMLTVLLSVVGALLILLHLRISQLRSTEKNFKMLSESLEGTITRARELMGQLKDDKADSVTAAMSDQLREAQESLSDLKLMSDRAEKILQQLDAVENGKKTGGKVLKMKRSDTSEPAVNGTNGANGKDPLATRPFSFTSQPLRTVSRGKSSSLYQAASAVTQTVAADDEEDVIKATKSEAEKRLRQALQGRL